MNAHQVDNIHAAKTPVKNRLLALDANAEFPLSVMPEGLQRRVSGNCTVGSAVRVVNADGGVVCESIPTAAHTPTAISTPFPTATPIDMTASGFVRAGVFTDCGPANVIRYFNNVNDKAITVKSALTYYGCEIDFGFDLTDSFLVATPMKNCPNCYAEQSVFIYSIEGTKATFATMGDNAPFQSAIYVLVY